MFLFKALNCIVRLTFKIFSFRLQIFNKNSDVYTHVLRQILDSSKLKQNANENFKFDDNGRKLSEWVENIVVKEEIARYEQFLLFPQCFQKTCTADQ